MAPRFSSAQYHSDRRPLGDANRDLGKGLLSIIPESSNGIDKNNVSRAVFVKDGLGHEIDEDPAEETDGVLFIMSLYFKIFILG